VPAEMTGRFEHAGCHCAELMPRMMSMCAEADQDADGGGRAETPTPGSEEGINP